MQTNWTPEDRDLLQNQFRILFDLDDSLDAKVPFEKLRDETFLSTFLPGLSEQLQTNQLLTLGSQLIKRLGFILTVPAFYMLAATGQKLPMKMNGLSLVSKTKDSLWLPHLYRSSWELTPVMHRADRELYLKGVIEEIAQIIQSVHKVARVPKPLLWENVAVYIYWLYETRLKEVELDLVQRKESWNDFAYLLQLDPQSFKERFNPLHRFYTNKIDVKGMDEPIRVRRTCCFYYETQDGKSYCQGCPKTDVNKAACMATKRQVLPIEMLPK